MKATLKIPRSDTLKCIFWYTKARSVQMFFFVSFLLTSFPFDSMGAVSTVFGAQDFVRSIGKPSLEIRNFVIESSKVNCTLRIDNGGLTNQYTRVSSAKIILNKKQVVRSSDFNQQIRVIEKTVDLTRNNKLTVEVQSNPSSGFTLKITCISDSENTPPIANAGANQSIIVGNTVQLDGSGSSDVDGNSLTYLWSLDAVPSGSNAMLSDAFIYNPTLYIDLPGDYLASLIVNDGSENSPANTVIISTENTAPIANAGTDQSAFVGNIVTLEGGASVDAEGDPLEYSWELIAKPQNSGALLSDINVINPQFDIDDPGSYIAELIVYDREFYSAPDQVVITTENTLPVADAGAGQNVFVGDTVTLDASGSTDVDGNPLSFNWSLITRPESSITELAAANNVISTFDIDAPGNYIAQLIVNDGIGNSPPDTVSISTENSPPIAKAGLDQTVSIGTKVQLDGQDSSDVDGDALSYLWSLLSTPDGSSALLSDNSEITPTFAVDLPGSYIAQLIVHDGIVESAADTVKIDTENSRPVADAGQDQTGFRFQLYTLNGNGSFDDDGDPLTPIWSLIVQPETGAAELFGNDTFLSTITPELPGSYVAQLIVYDGQLESVPNTVTLNIENRAPLADAGEDTAVFIGEQVSVDGSNSTDEDNDKLSFAWQIITKPLDSNVLLTAGSSDDYASFVPDKVGTYQLELAVNDGFDTSSAIITITATVANRTPSIISSAITRGRTGQNYHYDVLAQDPDAGDQLTFALTTQPVGMLINTVSGSIDWQPGADQAGTQLVTVQVVDRAGASDSQAFEIRVAASTSDNTLPQITSTPVTELTLDTAYTYPVIATDPDGDTLSYQLTSKPQDMTIDAATGRLDWTAAAEGAYPVVVTVMDAKGGQTSQSYILNVNELNLAPQNTSTPVSIATQGLPYQYAVEATDPNDDTLRFSLIEAPVGMTIDEITGIIDWLPTGEQVSAHTVIVQTTDSAGLEDTQNFTVTVSINLNDRPVADAGIDKRVVIGSTVTLNASGSFDPNGDALTYQWAFLSKPEGSAATLSDASLVNPGFEADVFGQYVLQLVVNDSTEDSAPDTVTLVATNQVTVGAHHTCALTKGGGVECWGSNYSGQLGIGTFSQTSELGPFGIPFPVTVISASDGVPLSGVTAISSGVGDHTCALMEAGGVTCWGWNYNGALGDGTGGNRSAAVDVLVELDGAPLTGITAIEIGGDTSCAITDEGGVKCWGWGNHGQLGNVGLIAGSVGARSFIPLDVLVVQGGEPLIGVTAVSAATLHTCAVMNDTSAKCWGNNDWGELGNGASLIPGQGNDRIFDPVDVLVEPGGAKLTGVVAISAGGRFTCALMDNTGVKCWGINFSGQLGNGIHGHGATDPANGTISTTPVDVLVEADGAPLTGVIAISAGKDHTCVLMEDSGVKCWGSTNGTGQLGDGTQLNIRFTPVDVLSQPGGAPLTGASTIAAGNHHTCAAMESGGIKCWGDSNNGQLGNGEMGTNEGGIGSYPGSQLTPVDTLLGLDAVLISVAIAPAGRTLAPGDTQQYSATGILSDGTTENLTGTVAWESINPAVATVDAAGRVTAISAGVTTLQISHNGMSRSASLVVSPATLVSIEVSPENAAVLSAQGRDSSGCLITDPDPCKPLKFSLTEQVYSAMGVYADGTRLDLTSIVTWTSTASAATITSDGLAVGVGLGESTISAGHNGVTGSGLLTVHEVVDADNTPPTVFLSPEDNTRLSGLTGILATVNDTNLLKYELAIAAPNETALQVLSTGSTPIDGVVATVDSSSLENGLYNVSLTAVDRGGNAVSITTRVYQVQDEAKIGLFQLSFIDLSVPVSGIPIEIVRAYDSRVKSREDFGIGWRLAVRRGAFKSNRIPGEGWQILTGGGIFGLPCQFVSETAFHTTEVRLSDVEYYRFRPTISQSAAISGGCTAEVGFAFVDGTTPGAMLEIMDGKGIFYESGTNRVLKLGSTGEVFDPKQVRLTTADGRIIELDQLSGGVTRVEDINGNALTITPEGITHTSGKSIAFTRDAQGRIIEITDPQGNVLKYAYDAAGDLVSFTDQAANLTTFSYDDRHNLSDIFDPLGNRAIRSEYDAAGRLIATIDAEGNRIELAHDIQNRREAITDSLGRMTVHEYDQQGNVLTTIDALGNRTTYTYDTNGNELTVTDPLGNVTTKSYDDSKNLLTETDPLGNVTTNTYTVRNQIRSTQDAEGNSTTYLYPITSGNLEAITGPLGHVTSLGYDRQGNLDTLSDPLGNATSYQYDGAGNRIQQKDPQGHVTSYTFDENGNELTATTQRTDASGNLVTQVTRNEYDPLNRVIKTTDPLGNITQTEYNAAGKVAAQIDENGRRTQFGYDTRGNQIRTLYPDGSEETVSYDSEGNQLSTTDRAGRTTSYAYDALNRLTQTTLPDGSNSRTVYDAASREVAVFDANGNETNTQFDVAGNRTGIVDTLGNETRFSYDAAGRQTQVTDATGNSTTSEHDAAGRRTRTVLPDGTDTKLAYDNAGRLTKKTDQAGNITTYVYDAQSRLVAVIDALAQRTEYSYDEQGNLLTQTDANGNTTKYEYDALGRRVATVLPLGQRSVSVYNAVGNLTSTTDFNGDTIGFVYDENDRLLTKQLPDGTTVTFSYTPSGQLETVTDARGTTRYIYDALDRLSSRTDPGGESIAYSYDTAGNRTSVTTSSGNTNYTFDALSRIKTVTAPDGGVTTYTYDVLGRLVRTELSNGTVETRAYNTLNRLVEIENRQVDSDTVISSFAYTLDPAGNRTAVDEHNGRRVEYSYDKLYRLKSEDIFNLGSISPTRTVAYIYDSVGNRLSRDDSSQGLTSYDYDTNDRLLDEIIEGVVTTYLYDNNGNTLSKTTAGTPIAYRWDFENRLAAADTDDDGIDDVEYQYDANDIRVAKTVNGDETRYLIDTNRSYAQVLEESNSIGDITALYIHGLDLISQHRGGQSSYYHVDGLGSTRALSDADGFVTDSYIYSAFGSIIAQTGNNNNPYLFAGEQRDFDINLDYLRARYVDPTVGRFISRDRFEAALSTPLARHKYAYTQNNAVNLIDPSGMFTIATVIAVSGVDNFGTHINLAQSRAGAKSIFALRHLVPEAVRLREIGLLGIADGVPGSEGLYQLGVHKYLEALSQIPKAFKAEYSGAAKTLAKGGITVHLTGGSNGFFGVGGLRNVFKAKKALSRLEGYTETATKWANSIEQVASIFGRQDTVPLTREIKSLGKKLTAGYAEISPFLNISIGPVKLAGAPESGGLSSKLSRSFNRTSVRLAPWVIRNPP